MALAYLVGGIAMAVSSSGAPLLGVRDPGTSALRRAREVLPSAGGGDVPGWLGGVVAAELSLALARHLVEDAHVQVGHGRARSGSGTGIDTATASGSEGGTSSSPKSLRPTVARRLDARSGSPHSGHASRYAAARMKRSRQGGQQRRVIGSPRVLSRQPTPASRTDPVHHWIVQARVSGLEIHPVAPPTEHPQDVSALTAILTASIGDSRGREFFGRRDQRSASRRRDERCAGH